MFKESKMTDLKKIALSAVAIAVMNGCGDTTIYQEPSNVTIIGDTITTTTGTTGTTETVTTSTSFDTILAGAKFLPQQTLAGNIGTSMTLTNDKLWVIDGLAVIKSGVTLTIEPGTVIAGLEGTGDGTSYMIVDKGADILADGTNDKPIIFTSMQRVEDPTNLAVGQWGGLTLIGHAGNTQVTPYEVNTLYEADATNMADSSGILRNVYILNSGITMADQKEINGLSLVGVGSGTVIEDITVDYSDDDGIEIWGGTANLTNITISNCTDDYFDIDDGYSGTVKNLVINTTTGNAGIEMSGTTAATFDGFTITTGETQKKEGAIFFKKGGIGGHFKNGTIIHNGGQITPDGAIHSSPSADGLVDIANVSFENVAITAPAELLFTGDSAVELENKFNAGSGNEICSIPTSATLAGNLTGCTILTADKIWELDGLVVVTSGSKLNIQEGTTIVGLPGTGDATSYMIVDKGAKISAIGTATKPIIFTSQDTAAQEVGLWGGLTLIGHAGNTQVTPYEVNTLYEADATNMADSSGILRNVYILNSGITMADQKEINGLSLVGVGSGTVIEDITVDYSDDDGIEIWGGTANLTNITISNCTDDYFDIDDGYSGTVKNLVINTTTGNAGIEMSGTTAATFDGFTITTGETQKKEGAIFFKKGGIGGHFKNGTIIHNGGQITPDGAIHSSPSADGLVDIANVSFENVAITTGVDLDFTGDSAADLETEFTLGTGNSVTIK